MRIQVSIVIPVFNKADYVAACVESALKQHSVRLEIICVDDASTDGSADLLDTLSRSNPNIRVIKNDKNCGPGIARNLGLSVARGEYLRFVDADDLLPPHSTAVLYETAVREGADLVRGSLTIFRGDQPNEVIRTIAVPTRSYTSFAEERLLWIPWWHTSYLISRKLINENHLSYPDLVGGEDPVFMASVLVKAKIISLVEDIVYLYRKYPKDRGSGGSTFQHVMDYFCHAKMIKEIFVEDHADCWSNGYSEFLLNDIRKFLKRCHLNHSELELVNSELKYIWGEEVDIKATT